MTEISYIARRLAGITDGRIDSKEALEKQTTLINGAVAEGYKDLHIAAADGKVKLHPHEIYGHVHEAHLAHQDILQNSLEQLERRVASRSAELQRVSRLYESSDRFAAHFIAKRPNYYRKQHRADVVRAAARITGFDNPAQFVYDIDGTITIEDPLYNYYDKTVPGTVFCDPAMARSPLGRSAFPLVFPAGWGMLQEPFAETFKSAGRQVTIRPGVNELMSELLEFEHPLNILTAGMSPLAEGILSQLPMRPFLQEVRSIKLDDVNSNNKPLNIRDMAGQDPTRAIIFVGDGGSDAPLAVQSLPIAFYFALKGGKFDTELTKANLLHFTYENHFDILETMGEIWEMGNQFALAA